MIASIFKSSLLFGALCGLTGPASPQTQAARQDATLIQQTVEQFLQLQTAGLPGEAKFNIGQIDKRLSLSTCPAPEAFLPKGSRLWGKTTIGVRCTTPSPWTIYVAVAVQVSGEYLVTATPLGQGQTIGANDIAKVKGDLTSLPNGIVTDPNQAIGRIIALPLPAGAPLRADALRTQQAVQQGQTVRLISSGPGFKVSTEARALNNATEGQVAQVKTASGQVVSGVAKTGGVVEVTY